MHGYSAIDVARETEVFALVLGDGALVIPGPMPERLARAFEAGGPGIGAPVAVCRCQGGMVFVLAPGGATPLHEEAYATPLAVQPAIHRAIALLGG